MHYFMATMSGRMHSRSQERILLLYLAMVLEETPFRWDGWRKHWPKKGYVVLATNHPGTTSRDSLPERTVMIWERAKDLTEILNWAENPRIEGLSLDTANISVAGFSLGGHSALAISGL